MHFFPTNVNHFLFSHMRLTLPPSLLNHNHNNNNSNYYHRHKLLSFTSFLSTFFKPNKPKTTTMKPPAAVVNRRRRRKVVVLMGPTGAGKSRLSIDLVKRYFHDAEIINSDKMQVYDGLNHTTNKITDRERKGVKHHLLGVVDPTRPAFTPSDFRRLGSVRISKMASRGKIPVVVGGSNSFIYSLLTKRFDPGRDVFGGPDPDPVSSELRYDVCFVWVDVCLPVLNHYLSRRVDEMLECGMFDELSAFFRSGEYRKVNRSGLGQAIGVPEFEGYFSKFVENSKCEDDVEGGYFGKFDGRGEEYEEVVRRIKENTCQLAKRQVAKILRLRDGGWDLKRVDATEAFKAVLADGNGGGGSRVSEIWEKQVVEPSMKIVKRFLDE